MPFAIPIAFTPNTKRNIQRTFADLPVIIEHPKYSMRQGPGWMNATPADYGYIEGTTGADGDEMDCYLGPNESASNVYVVDQNVIGDSAFDEHKCMLGYSSAEEAKHDYMLGHSDSHKIFRAITALTMLAFIAWLKSGNHKVPLGK